MPRLTARQQASRDLAQAYLASIFIENMDAMNVDNEMDCSSESSDSVKNDDSDDESGSDMVDEWDDIEASNQILPISQLLLSMLQSLHKSRFLEERRSIPRTQEQLTLILTIYKQQLPDLFKSFLRIQPATFDALLIKIQNNPVFHNQSKNEQIPVERQLAVALYRFGHFGNAASLTKVASWAGMGYGTVNLCTRRVLLAICDEEDGPSFMSWPVAREIEEAKIWVEQLTCAGWRNGWSMVDGTLVPLYARPAFYGNSWYDRKSNYSMNVQIVSLPNLRIIDYSVGLPGSQHDATAWKETRMSQEHDELLGPNEWVWGDSAYPLQHWCQAPYKKPEKDIPENSKHNYYLSKVRVRSEHCMGYLKGRFSSLRGLRLHIDNSKHIKIAAIWIMVCILLHNFALTHEGTDHLENDEFFQQGMELMTTEDAENAAEEVHLEELAILEENQRANHADTGLREGQAKREALKRALLRHLDT